MRSLWLIFAQTVTVLVAALFVVVTLKPEWLPDHRPPVWTMQSPNPVGTTPHTPGSLAGAAKKALPSVVHIFTSTEVRTPISPFFNDPLFRHFLGEQFGTETQRRTGLGSGVIATPDGYILTNYHVVERASSIEVALNDGRKLKARTVGADPESDIAVLHIQADKLPAITFGHPDRAQVGDVVLAIGNPFGVGQTVTMGIVSAMGRSHLGINTLENFIQTDAAINPGNSGGALLDLDGNLIGINAAIYGAPTGMVAVGIGFAIPVEMARADWGTAAAKAGLALEDIVVGFNGMRVRNARDLSNKVGLTRAGATVQLAVLRRGQPLDVSVTVAEAQ